MGTINKLVLLRLLFKWQWVVIPLLIVAALECVLRKSDMASPLWYSRAEAIASGEKVDFAFIGSSKVAAAFVEKAFNHAMARILKRKVISINLGQGWSSPQLHYLGLRNLIRKHSESLRGVTLFVEALAGVPLYQYHKQWKSRWITKQPQIFIPLLRYSDLGPFWKTLDTTTTEKLYITLKYILAQSYIINFRERARHKYEKEGQRILDKTMRLLFRMPPPLPEPKPVIQDIGGIKTNPKNFEKIRKFGLKYYLSISKKQRILNQWDKSVLADIIKLVKQRGGKVYFVNLPAYSAELNAYHSPEHETNKRIICKQLNKWGVAMFTPNFQYTDDDIPDYFHLRISRAAEFSKKMARAYLKIAHFSKKKR